MVRRATSEAMPWRHIEGTMGTGRPRSGRLLPRSRIRAVRRHTSRNRRRGPRNGSCDLRVVWRYSLNSDPFPLFAIFVVHGKSRTLAKQKDTEHESLSSVAERNVSFRDISATKKLHVSRMCSACHLANHSAGRGFNVTFLNATVSAAWVHMFEGPGHRTRR